MLILLVPRARQIGDFQLIVDQGLLKLKADDDVQIVGCFIRLHANERRLHVVDGEVNVIERNIAE